MNVRIIDTMTGETVYDGPNAVEDVTVALWGHYEGVPNIRIAALRFAGAIADRAPLQAYESYLACEVGYHACQ